MLVLSSATPICSSTCTKYYAAMSLVSRLSVYTGSCTGTRAFRPLQWSRSIGLLTTFRFGDNCDNAKRVSKLDQPYCIKLPKNRKWAGFGDIIRIAHRGKTHMAMIVTHRQTSVDLPRYDSSYIIMLNEKLEPAGTRILIPLPTAIRQKKDKKFSKVIAIASRFI